MSEDDMELFPKDKIKRIKNIVGSFLHYARSINITILKVLNTLATQQTKPTINTKNMLNNLLTITQHIQM